MSSAARAFEQRSAAAVARVVAELDAGGVPDAGSPSVAAGGLDFRAAQIAKDAELAAQLQREEYRIQEERTERRRQRRAASAAEQNSSWMDWLVGTAPSGSATSGAAPASNSTSSEVSPSLVRPASSSMGMGGGGARVARPSSSMFACVAQSITSVMGPPQGDVNGVDSTSLL